MLATRLDRFTLEEIATISEPAAIRRYFDAENLPVIRILSMLIGILVGAESIWVVFHTHELAKRSVPAFVLLLVLVLQLIATLLAVLVAWDLHDSQSAPFRVVPRPTALVERDIRGWTLSYLIIQFLLGVGFFAAIGSEGWIALLSIFPWLTVTLRLRLRASLLLYAVYVGSMPILIFTTQAPSKPDFGIAFAFAFADLLPLGIQLFRSRSARIWFLTFFRRERASALEQLRMRDELRSARELQLSMLPEGAPQLDWLDLAAASNPATEVGGDYYDYFVLDDDRIAVVEADVAGHGLSSGIVLASIRGGLSLLREDLGDPAVVLRRLHAMLLETTRQRTLVTATIALFDRGARRVSIANAGHPPLIRRRADGELSFLDLFSPPLGVRLQAASHRCTAFDLEAGDLFLFHSDGIYESTDPDGAQYGLDRLLALIAAQPSDVTAAEARDAVLADLAAFRNGSAQHDDITIVVAIVRGI